MIKHLTYYEAVRELQRDNWSRLAAFAIVNYYEAIEDNLKQDIEFDIDVISCDWNEYSEKELLDLYKRQPDDTLEDILDYLEDRTYVERLAKNPPTYLVKVNESE